MASYTPKGLFLLYTESEILEIVAKAKSDLIAGRVLTSYSDSGTNVTKQVTLPIEQVLLEARYALQRLNPTEYGSLSASRISTIPLGGAANL